MSERKNVDTLFQEKFKNLEVAPPKDSWQQLESKLVGRGKPKARSSKWYKIAGIAAAVATMFVVFEKYEVSITKKNAVVAAQNSVQEPVRDKAKSTIVVAENNSKNKTVDSKSNKTIANTELVNKNQDTVNKKKLNFTSRNLRKKVKSVLVYSKVKSKSEKSSSIQKENAVANSIQAEEKKPSLTQEEIKIAMQKWNGKSGDENQNVAVQEIKNINKDNNAVVEIQKSVARPTDEETRNKLIEIQNRWNNSGDKVANVDNAKTVVKSKAVDIKQKATTNTSEVVLVPIKNGKKETGILKPVQTEKKSIIAAKTEQKKSSETIAVVSNKNEKVAAKEKLDKLIAEKESEKIAATKIIEKKDVSKNDTPKNYVNNAKEVEGTKSLAVLKENVTESKTTLIEKNTTIKPKNDSTKLAAVESNTLEKLLNEKEKKKIAEQKLNRWQITPNIAPIYFSSTLNGSPLDDKFNSNKKEYNNTQGYGLNVNYALNERIRIRTGINIMLMDHTTKDLVYYENPNNSRLANLNPNALGAGIEIENIKNLNPVYNRNSSASYTPSNYNFADLNQKMGYLEFPLEISYKIIKSKFSVDLISGMSALYLRQNDVFLKTATAEIKIGEAQNLTQLHYSGNFGIGFNYNFLKNFDASVEPIYKYQLNTFTNSSENFSPYIFGIYTGLSYKF